MEKIRWFYSVALIGLINGESVDPTTLVYKPGKTIHELLKNRGLTKEFENANNACSRQNISSTLQYKVTEEIEGAKFGAPDSLTGEFEVWVNAHYLNKSPKFFVGADSLQEYLTSCKENADRIDYMNKVINKNGDSLSQLLGEYKALLDSKADIPQIRDSICARYKQVLDGIKKSLLSYGMSPRKMKPVQMTTPVTAPSVATPPPTLPIVVLDAYNANVLKEHFVFYFNPKSKKVYLQGLTNKRHQTSNGKMKNPVGFQVSWGADLSKKGNRFQFHDSGWAKKKGFIPKNPVAQDVANIFLDPQKCTRGVHWFVIDDNGIIINDLSTSKITNGATYASIDFSDWKPN